MRLAFMGSPDFAVPALTWLAESDHQVAAVYCQPPRPAGRGQKVRLCPVHRAAEMLGLSVRHPASLKPNLVIAEWRGLELDGAVVSAYGLILPPAILTGPGRGCLNLHASLLPRWRGAAPIQRALLAGDRVSGVTLMQMDRGLDTGPILAAAEHPVGPAETGGSLHDALSLLARDLLADHLDDWLAGRLRPRPQPQDGVCYAGKIARADGSIAWRNAEEVDRQVRALNPWPGAWCTFGDLVLKIRAGTVSRDDFMSEAPAGTVLDGALKVACGDGSVYRIDRLQRPGRKPQDHAAFLRGTGLPPGSRLMAA